MFVTIDGSYAANPLPADEWHILLAHLSLPDTLVLSHFPSGVATPHLSIRSGWPQTEDRNARGILPIQGSMARIKTEFQSTFLGSKACCDLFDQLLAAQNGNSSVTLIDRFYGQTQAYPVWLNVDQQYKTPYVEGRWWTLQFRALEDN
jgi:hypothetical protein